MGGMKTEWVGAWSRPGRSPVGSGQRAAGELREAGRPSMSIALYRAGGCGRPASRARQCGARRLEPT